MPRVHTLKANKDYPEIGVKKGETYYKWQCYKRPVQKSKTYPRPTQLSSAKTAQVEEAIQDCESQIGDAASTEDMKSAMEDLASMVGEIADEYEESADNIEAHFEGSSTAEECREKADALRDFQGEVEGWEPDEEVEEIEEVDDADYDGDDPEETDIEPEEKARRIAAREEWRTQAEEERQERIDNALEAARDSARDVLGGYSL